MDPRRIARELHGAHRPPPALYVTRRDRNALVGFHGERPLDAASPSEGDLESVTIVPGVYDHIRGRASRVALLQKAAALAPCVVVHAETRDDAGRAARLLLDVPRRLAGAAPFSKVRGLLPEARDRFPAEGFVHLFVDDEELLCEAQDAGLRLEARGGDRLVLTHGRDDERADTFAIELARVVRVLPRVVSALRLPSPRAVVDEARALGRDARRRGPMGRARLRRAASWVDALTPPGPSCLRRVICEVALDGGAAAEALVFGLDVGRTGHVAFKNREPPRFDVAFEIPP